MRYMLTPGSVDLALEGSRFPAGISSCEVSPSEISITYIGMGGGGVGAAACRSDAKGVLRSRCDESGGGKVAGSTIWLPRMQRLLIGVDDTDTPDEGATWTLVHNIAKSVDNENSVYLSHTIVQFYPVPYRTKNCVGLVAEFATTDPEDLIKRFHKLLEKYTLSKKTGMAVYRGFTPSRDLLAFGRKVKRGEINPGLLESLNDPEPADIIMDGRGVVGAVAALPFYTNYRGGFGTMQWKDLKARLLAVGQAHLTGETADTYIARSTAGPGAGGSGAVFFAMGSHRVKLALNPVSSIEIAHRGNGTCRSIL